MKKYWRVFQSKSKRKGIYWRISKISESYIIALNYMGLNVGYLFEENEKDKAYQKFEELTNGEQNNDKEERHDRDY